MKLFRGRIKQILQDINLIPDEVFTGKIYPQIHSLRIQLSEEKGSFGTNGKGRSREYALASAYAEFLERIQNGLYANSSRTLLSELKKSYGFYYYPDVKYLQEKDILKLPDAILNDFIRYTGKSKQSYIKSYVDCIKQNRIPGIVVLPFMIQCMDPLSICHSIC